MRKAGPRSIMAYTARRKVFLSIRMASFDSNRLVRSLTRFGTNKFCRLLRNWRNEKDPLFYLYLDLPDGALDRERRAAQRRSANRTANEKSDGTTALPGLSERSVVRFAS